MCLEETSFCPVTTESARSFGNSLPSHSCDHRVNLYTLCGFQAKSTDEEAFHQRNLVLIRTTNKHMISSAGYDYNVDVDAGVDRAGQQASSRVHGRLQRNVHPVRFVD